VVPTLVVVDDPATVVGSGLVAIAGVDCLEDKLMVGGTWDLLEVLDGTGVLDVDDTGATVVLVGVVGAPVVIVGVVVWTVQLPLLRYSEAHNGKKKPGDCRQRI